MNILDQLAVTAAFALDNGLFLDVPDRRGNFWLYLGDLVGWGRFSRRVNRKPDCVMSTVFELVEVLPAHSPAPSPVLSLANVLWRRREAIEAERDIPFLRELLTALGQGISQSGQGCHHEV